jgi:hypothetical protein
MVDPKEREKLKQDLIQRDDMDSLSNFFRSLVVRPTSQELTQPVVQEKQEISPPKDALVEELLAQNSEERDQYYQDLLTGLQAGAGEFSMQPGQPEVYTGPTKEELFKSLIAAEQSQLSKEEAVTPDILKKQVDLEQELEKLPQIKPKPVIAEQPQPEEDKEQPKAETTDEPVFAEKPKSYYDIFDINLFRKGYNFHNPRTDDDRTGEIWTGRYNEAMKIETPEILQNTVDRVLKAFPELNSKNKGNFYNEDFFIKLGKFESNAGQNLFNPKTRDYGMFQLNEDNLKRIFGDTKDFVNDTYKKGPKKGKKISAEEAKKRGKKANETFKNSFGVYYGKGIENITNITAEELKELFVKDRGEFLKLIKNNHDVNLGIAISGSILPNLQK